MHELAVTQSVLEIALRHAEEAGGGRITDLYLVIGRLSSVVDDSVQFYWDIISQGTPAEGATLHFRRVPVAMRCEACDVRYAPEGEDLSCPSCRGTRVTVVAGDEFQLEALDVDDGAKASPRDAASGAPDAAGEPGTKGLDGGDEHG